MTVARKSAEGIVSRAGEGPNGRERRVGAATHERQATEKPDGTGLCGGEQE